MNSLEFIENIIKNLEETLKVIDNRIQENQNYPTLLAYHVGEKEHFEKELAHFQQVKAELEIMELIGNGWSSIEQTVSGEKIIKFEKLNLDDWLKVWKTLEEIALKKALEVEDE